MYKLSSKRHQLGYPFQKIVGQLITETHSLCLMFIQIDCALSTPGSLILLQLNLIVFLRITARCLSSNLHGSIRYIFTISNLPALRTWLITNLKKRRCLVTVYSHLVIIIGRITVDLLPCVIRTLWRISLRNSKIHRHNTRLVIIFIETILIPEVNVVDILCLCLFYLFLLFCLFLWSIHCVLRGGTSRQATGHS